MAYRGASSRIVLQQHEASEGTLKVKGRCQEVLDVADYMKTISEKEKSVRPILIELTQVSEKEKPAFYQFTLQLSQTGGANT